MSAKLGELISGIKSAIVDAHRSVENQHLEELEHFFEFKGDGSKALPFPQGEWQPKVVNINILKEISVNGNVSFQEHQVKVPLITLVPIRSYVIDRAEVLTKVKLGMSDAGDLAAASASNAGDAATEEAKSSPEVTVQMGMQDEMTAELKIVVHGLDAPSGMQKIVAAYEKLLSAQLPT